MQRFAFPVLAMLIAALLGARPALAQGPTAEGARAMLRLEATGVAPPVQSNAMVPLRVRKAERDYTVTGLLVGAGLGFVGGWAFYNTLCEAVDNHCGNPRSSVVIPWTLVGAGLGALVGGIAS